MSVALYIVVESEPPDLDVFVNGKSLAKAQPELDAMAKTIGVLSLGDFISADEDSRAFLIEETGIDPDQIEGLATTKWFSADDGLKTVMSLLQAIQKNSGSFKNSERVLADLEEFRVVLQKIAERGLRWHLAVDF